MCFDFPYYFISNIYHSKKNSARYDHKCKMICTWTARYSCQILTKLDVSRHILATSTNIKFHKNPSCGSRVVSCGLSDRQTDMTKLKVTFRSFAKAPECRSRWDPSCSKHNSQNCDSHWHNCWHSRQYWLLVWISHECLQKICFIRNFYWRRRV